MSNFSVGAYGIYIYNSQNNNISGNDITSVTNGGISVVSGSHSNTLTSNIIHDSTVTYAIQLTANNVSLISNQVYNISTYSVFVNGHNNNFSGNTFNTSWYGPILQSSHNNTLFNNTISGNSVDGIQIQGSNGNNISFNILSSNNQIGINLISTTSNDNRIFSNSIYNHTNGTATGILVNGVNAVNYIYNNLVIENNTYGIYLDSSSFTNITNNTLTTNNFTIYVNNSFNSTLNLNTLSNTLNYSIRLFDANYSDVLSNTIVNASLGIYLSNSKFGTMRFLIFLLLAFVQLLLLQIILFYRIPCIILQLVFSR